MSLIKCPECGKEISDKAPACPNCGCPQSEFNKKMVKELPPEERPEMFSCVNCGRPLPVGIEKCIYCDQVYRETIYENLKKESETGVLGRKNLMCPRCNSKNIKIENDIPFYKKAMEIILVGGILPTTKHDYAKDMIYHCKSCGYSWRKDYL